MIFVVLNQSEALAVSGGVEASREGGILERGLAVQWRMCCRCVVVLWFGVCRRRFVRSFVRSLRSFVRFVRFVRRCVVAVVPSFLPSFLRSFLRSFVPSFLRSFAPSFFCLFICSFVRLWSLFAVSPLLFLFCRRRSFVRCRRSFVRSFVRCRGYHTLSLPLRRCCEAHVCCSLLLSLLLRLAFRVAVRATDCLFAWTAGCSLQRPSSCMPRRRRRFRDAEGLRVCRVCCVCCWEVPSALRWRHDAVELGIVCWQQRARPKYALEPSVAEDGSRREGNHGPHRGKCTFQQRTQRDYTRAPHASSGRTFQWHCLTCPGDSPRFFKRDIARAALQLQVEILFCRCLSPLCRVVFRFLFLFLCLLLGLSVLCPPFAVAGLVAGRQQAFPSLHCSHFSPSLFCRKQRKSGLVRQGRRSLE